MANVLIFGKRSPKTAGEFKARLVPLTGFPWTERMQADQDFRARELVAITRRLYDEMKRQDMDQVELWEPWRSVVEEPVLGLRLYRRSARLRGSWADDLRSGWLQAIVEGIKLQGAAGATMPDLRKGMFRTAPSDIRLPYVASLQPLLRDLLEEGRIRTARVTVPSSSSRRGKRRTVYIHPDHVEA